MGKGSFDVTQDGPCDGLDKQWLLQGSCKGSYKGLDIDDDLCKQS